MKQQTLTGCAICDASSRTADGEAQTWGRDERVTLPICVDCAVQAQPDPDVPGHHACDDCGLVVDALAALTRFRVELGHLEGTLQLCAPCSPNGPATYWTRDRGEHRVATSVKQMNS